MNRSLSSHSREGGNPVRFGSPLDPRLRGDDGLLAALDAESAEVLQTIRRSLSTIEEGRLI